jgi:predicted dehydrogenase
MNSKINWGIIGLGNIATLFASDLQLSKNAVLYGVASRNIEKARKFSATFNSVKYFDSYEELAKTPEIDVIYIATPHAFHFENTMMCLKNNKAVLCEKPLGIDSYEVKTMLNEAKSKKLFLMEGIWTRFIPTTVKLIELLKDDAIGDLLFIRADFGFKADLDLEGRIYNKKLGGGSLLDIGIYPIYLSLLTLGFPIDIKAMARMTQTEVDSYCAILFDYENSSKAFLESTIEADTPTEAYIYGSKGHIKMHSSFHHSQKISLYQNRQLKEVFDLVYQGNGYLNEIEEVNSCLKRKELESNKLPQSVSLNLITLIDRIKDEIGLSYGSRDENND